jgi:hypothetical protein
MQKLSELGRRRLWARLPKFRRALETGARSAELNDLFEAYALAAERVAELREPEQSDQRLLFEYEVASRGIEEEVTRLLTEIHGDPVNNTLSATPHESGLLPNRIRIRASWQSSY